MIFSGIQRHPTVPQSVPNGILAREHKINKIQLLLTNQKYIFSLFSSFRILLELRTCPFYDFETCRLKQISLTPMLRDQMCAGPSDLGSEGTSDLLYFGRSNNLIKIRAGYAHYSSTHPRPQGFLDLLMALIWRRKMWICRLMVIGHQWTSIGQEGKYMFYFVKFAKKNRKEVKLDWLFLFVVTIICTQ